MTKTGSCYCHNSYQSKYTESTEEKKKGNIIIGVTGRWRRRRKRRQNDSEIKGNQLNDFLSFEHFLSLVVFFESTQAFNRN